MMRRLVALSLCCAAALAPRLAAAQLEERTARNTLYVELAGNAGIYSVNYERFLADDFSFRLGGGYLGLTATSTGAVASASASMLTIPATLSFFGLRSGNHAFELGAGAVYVSFSGSASSSTGTDAFGTASGFAGTAIAGYRYAPVNGGFNFRLAFTPLFGQGGFLPWFGLAAGYGF